MDEITITALVAAARGGDLDALRAMGDLYRERGDPGDPESGNSSDLEIARCLDVLVHEWQIAFVQARQVRVVLPQIGTPIPHPRYSDADLARSLSDWGLPIEITNARDSDVPGATILLVPTDHRDEVNTRNALLRLLRAAYPNKTFGIRFGHRPYSEAARTAMCCHWELFDDHTATAEQPAA